MLDNTNKKIISELKKDSRQPIRDISKKTGLRPSTVHNRIKKLVDDGTITNFTIKLNNAKTGENFIVFILVNSEKEIPEIFFKKDNIKEVFGITGEHDLLLKCKFKDIEDFNKFILEFRKIPEISKTITMVSTTTIKEEL
ncbi:MAG: Lrp/AsnC family transcriptional regulator [Nanoarchaeota archaeon]